MTGEVGFIMTVFGEEVTEATKAIGSFLETLDYPSKIVMVASNINRDRLDIVPTSWKVKKMCFEHPTSLTFALNRGIMYFLADESISYIGWLHGDMEFPQPWVSILVKRLDSDHTIGKISPNNLRDGSQEERMANEQGWIIPARIFREVGLFDENFIGGGIKEDWDHNRRIMNAGYRCLVTPDANIFHHAMQTRNREGTTNAEIAGHNMGYYFTKWGTDDPPC